MRPQIGFLCVLLTLVFSLGAHGCSTPADPTLGCNVDGDCNTGETCKKGVCVGDREFICAATADCLTALEQDKWNPTALDTLTGAAANQLPACYDAQCVAEFCKLATRAQDTKCDDDDGLPCTQGACDDKGACQAAASLVPDTCLIDTAGTPTCYAKDKVNIANACEICVPAVASKAWSGMPIGASCDDKDKLSCTTGRCDGAGKCDTCKDGVCAGAATIALDACLIDGACVQQDDKKTDSHGCEVCSPTTSQSKWSAVKDGEACEKDGEACRPGACASGTCEFKSVLSGFCYIPDEKAGACVKDGALQSTNSCQVCDAGNAPTAWTAKQLGEACKSPDGYVCTLDQCNSAGNCVGTPKDSLCQASGACTQGKCDTTAKSCTTVNLAKAATCTGDDGVDCTVEHCDGNGSCDNAGIPDKSGCDDQLACTVDACDPAATKGTDGCTHTPTNSACDDGNLCTDNVCDAQKGCVASDNTKSCDKDSLACTQEKCDAGACKVNIDPGTCVIDAACQKTDDKSPSGCTSCQPTVDNSKWSPLQKGVVCADDKLPCTVDECDGKGACSHAQLVAETCLVQGVCLAKGKKSSGGCLVCAPSVKTTAWTAVAPATACDVDNYSCTEDACDGKGVCAHAPQDAKCDDGLGCTRDACAPTSAFAQGATGCENVDRCAYGHSCDKTAKACLTPKPVVLVTAGATDPEPTNPAVLRHVLDAKTGTTRTWVVYQSQSCATASGGKWGITKPAQLRAVVLDSVEESKPGVGKAKPVTVTFAAALAGKDVCQGFPVVAVDPNSTSQGWLSWLEGDVKAGTCLKSGYQGGIPRLARLDGAAVTAGVAWDAAGAVCPDSAGQKPSFLTSGFAVLPGAEADASKRGGIWARPSGFSLSETGLNQVLLSGAVGKGVWAKATPGLSEFSTVHPVVVDTGKADKAGTRFWVLALDEKNVSGTYTRELWAQGMSAAGVETTKTKWLSSTTSGLGDLLAGTSAVCSLDAAVDPPTGDVGMALVTRKGGKNFVWLLVRNAADGVMKSVQIQSKSGADDCRQGYAAARVAISGSNWFVATFEAVTSKSPSSGDIEVTRVVSKEGIKSIWTGNGIDLTTTDSVDGATATPTVALAWRGLADLQVAADGALTLVLEMDDATGKRAIAVHSFMPK